MDGHVVDDDRNTRVVFKGQKFIQKFIQKYRHHDIHTVCRARIERNM